MEPMRHNWSCEETEAQLTEYLDGTLAASTRAQVEAHVASCAGCASMIANVGGLLRRLARLEPVAEPPNLASAILAATLGPRRGKSDWKAWSGWLRPFSQPRFAYGAVSVMVTVVVLSQALGIHWRAPAIADLNPANLAHVANREAHQVYARGMKVVSDLRLVYEIQTRLQPANETEQTTEPPAAPPRETIPPDHDSPRRLMNRIDRNFPLPHQASLTTHTRLRRSIG
jgi:anti-sigma factor RsiW